jgi:DNA-binding NtrC family response regulator
MFSRLLQGDKSMLPTASANAGAAPALPLASSRSRSRTVLLACPDPSLRVRLRQSLVGLRWQVLEAEAGAEAWLACQAEPQLEAMVVDSWLPDLDVHEFLADFRREHPQVDLMMTDGTQVGGSLRSPYHQELLYAMRRSQELDTAAWKTAPAMGENQDMARDMARMPVVPQAAQAREVQPFLARPSQPATVGQEAENRQDAVRGRADLAARDGLEIRRSEHAPERIPELIGNTSVMLEVSRRIRLVAGRTTPVLIEGPTGSGKELVAEALHRLSNRSRKPFVAINCAAIPEALLEAELFGHTRGAFTGAVQGRTGRIESADGGTLFLDEIGEMPLPLQSKLLRFFESGELQRIGDNETVKVDVRIVAATHQPLAEDAQKGIFRADLYYRLAVFLVRTPALLEHMEDLPLLVAHFMERLGRKSPVKRVDSSAMRQLSGHSWPGNVRELEHVLERASILAGDEPAITAAEIDFGYALTN